MNPRLLGGLILAPFLIAAIVVDIMVNGWKKSSTAVILALFGISATLVVAILALFMLISGEYPWVE